MTRTFVLIILVCLTGIIRAQNPPALMSPEVRADRTLVVKLWAPLARDVQLVGNWMGPQPPVGMMKDAAGVWTATAGPFEPNIYEYAFLVDGVRTIDPVCKCGVMWAGRFASSRFTVPATPAQSWELQNRPAGTLHQERFFSPRQQITRRFVVYTPPGYESSGTRRYPALVLTPGTPGDESDWTNGGGFADVMFDNLIASGTMVPAVVIMHASDVLDPPDLRRGDENLQAFETIVMDELLPIVKQRYRVSTDPRMWAIAGLSLGGEFGLYVGLKHPEQFRTIASISGSLVANSFEARFPLKDPKRVAADYRLIWLGTGTEDIWRPGAQAFAERLTNNGIRHVFREYPGAHVMPVFRRQLNDLLPRLFQP